MIRPKKALGQCFLKNPKIAQRIAQEIDEPNTVVVEIGPGTGALTREILANTNLLHLVAIEKDEELAQKLKEEYKDCKDKVTIISGDATKVDLQSVLWGMFKEQCQNRRIVMLSNLPYNVGTQIVMNAITNNQIFSKIVVMLQEEVVNRIIAKPSTKSYSALSVIAQSLCEVKKIMSVSPGSFNPAPKVFSAVVRLEPREQSINPEVFKILEKITHIGFGNRRKKFLKNIASLKNSPITSVVRQHVGQNQRAEEVPVGKLIQIAEQINRDVICPNAKQEEGKATKPQPQNRQQEPFSPPVGHPQS